MEATVSEKTINVLLKPLGMQVCQLHDGFRIETFLNTGCMFRNASGWSSYVETHLPKRAGLDAILGIISKSTKWVADSYSQLNSWKNVDNPYFGCNSLEEMFIKRDLIAYRFLDNSIEYIYLN